MANTYTQLCIHCVFAPKFRAALLLPHFDTRLRLYISAIIQNRGHKMLAINNVPDHIHLFFGLNPRESIASVMDEVKGESSRWINESRFLPGKFNWQAGYGAFSHSKSQVDAVVRYIDNQQVHHRTITFLDEYKKLLQDFGLNYDARYIFKEPE